MENVVYTNLKPYLVEYMVKGEASPSIKCQLGEWKIILQT